MAVPGVGGWGFWAQGESACLWNGGNNHNKKSNNKDGKRNAREDLWHFAYDDGDLTQKRTPKLKNLSKKLTQAQPKEPK